MSGYFSFQRLISTWFIQVMYFVGFVLISAAGIGLAIWAGLRLRDANIARDLGWRYVAAGAGLLILGNIVWRVFCECWIVLFNLLDELVAIRQTIGIRGFRREPLPAEVHDEPVIERVPAVREVVHTRPAEPPLETHKSSSVLGLS